MYTAPPTSQRQLRSVALAGDLVIVGGGMAGCCCAITAARAGLRVILIQDRPVLGGNASSEVRLWVLGATAHMHNNNRWSREGGVLDELLVENTYRNPEGNPLLFDSLLLEKVVAEPTITLLLNTAVFEAQKARPDQIAGVRAFCSQSSTLYEASAPLFVDASGDGVLGFLAGAAFRMGAEPRAEFGEGMAPSSAYGELLGHSLYFYSKDVGRPVHYTPPSFALADITRIPRFRSFNTRDYGCRLWWIEYGGRLDTVHDTEQIKWELWRVVYGVWDYIKNSGNFPEAETLTLEWVGQISGKRESRRFEGDYMLRQQDLVEQRSHPDAVASGGWAIDLHPADGIYSELPGCTQWHTRGVYQIPYRSLYSRTIANLFLAGRIISVSHVAFGSTRVMATLAHAAQAVGLAAAHCLAAGVEPAALVEPAHMRRLQRDLLRGGQHIPGLRLSDPDDLAQAAQLSASSTLRLAELPADGPALPLTHSRAQLLPCEAGPTPALAVTLDVEATTELTVELRASERRDSYTPDVLLDRRQIALAPGVGQRVTLPLSATLESPCYLFVCLMRNPAVAVRASSLRPTGLLAVGSRADDDGPEQFQEPPPQSGVERFPLWVPERRPAGHNLALSINPPIDAFRPANVRNGYSRPTAGPNAWVADPADPAPALTLRWPAPQTIAEVQIGFDTDHDHAMESVLRGHPERAMPACVRHFQLLAGEQVVAEATDHHQTRAMLRFDPPLTANELTLRALTTHGGAPPAIFELRCYGPPKGHPERR